MFGLRPWLAFFRRTLAFFLEVRFDIADEATGGRGVDSRRAGGESPDEAQSGSSIVSSLVVVDQLRMVMR
jgi:hypothetical protein